jgi:hypothetical protein
LPACSTLVLVLSIAHGESTLTFGASPKAPLTLNLSKLSDALIDLGFGVGEAEELLGEGLAEVGVAAGAGEAASAAGLSLLHPKSSNSDEASPRTTATLTGEEGTGEGYSVRLLATARAGLRSEAAAFLPHWRTKKCRLPRSSRPAARNPGLSHKT